MPHLRGWFETVFDPLSLGLVFGGRDRGDIRYLFTTRSFASRNIHNTCHQSFDRKLDVHFDGPACPERY